MPKTTTTRTHRGRIAAAYPVAPPAIDARAILLDVQRRFEHLAETLDNHVHASAQVEPQLNRLLEQGEACEAAVTVLMESLARADVECQGRSSAVNALRTYHAEAYHLLARAYLIVKARPDLADGLADERPWHAASPASVVALAAGEGGAA